MISALIRGGRASLQAIGTDMDRDTDIESRVKQAKRWLMSKWTDTEVHFIPYVLPILRALGKGRELVLAIDGSAAGDGCMALMISAIWRKRAIPICWVVRQAEKGHFPEQMHVDLVKQVPPILAQAGCSCPVVLLGDGEFDGADLQQACRDAGWQYVLRTRQDTLLCDHPDGQGARPFSDVRPDFGRKSFFMPDMYLNKERFGPLNALFWHDPQYKDPLYLLTNLEHAPSAIRFYRKRFRIETLFGDIKSRGFNIHRTRIANPQTLSNLLIVVSLAYILALLAEFDMRRSQYLSRFCRKDRINSLSIFQIGLRGIRFAIKHGYCLSFQFSNNFP